LVSGFLESLPPHRCELIWSGHGCPGFAGCSCLPRIQRYGAADDDQVAAAVQAGDDHVGPGDRAEDAADDHLSGAGEVGADFAQWCRREDGITVTGVANPRALPRLVVVELLGGLQLRTGQGCKTRPSRLNRLAREARAQQAGSLRDVDPEGFSDDLKSLATLLLRDLARATVSPGEEQRKDHWDLAVLGATGRIDFTGLTQPWLRELAKHWASEDLARRRGGGAGTVVRTHIGSLIELSTTLRLTRLDHGLEPAAFGPGRHHGLPDPVGSPGTDRDGVGEPASSDRPARPGCTAGCRSRTAPQR
jgi:hypothetical protein